MRKWNTPDFEDITVSMEVTAYANTDESQLDERAENRETEEVATEER